MPDIFDETSEPESVGPEELCRQAFSRCSNWPDDRSGQIGLAQGLKLAAERFKLTQPELIARCRELSSFCPTDADLLKVAAEMWRVREDQAEANRNRESEWRKEAGERQPFDFETEARKISAFGREATRKRALMRGLMKQEAARRGKRLGDMGTGEHMQLQVWAQEQVGIEVTREQRHELTDWHGLPALAILRQEGDADAV